MPGEARIEEIDNTLRRLSDVRARELNDCTRLAQMPFYEAAMEWLESRRPFIGPRTFRDYTSYIAILATFFGERPLEALASPDLIRAYQLERSKTCGPRTVNRECSIIQQLLKRIRRWNEVAPFYEAIPLPSESCGRALTPEEEWRLFEAGALNPKWATAYRLAVLSANTAAGPGELLGLRFRDVFVENPETARIYIHEDAKNRHRVREVPLNADAVAAVKGLLEIARSRGAGLPEHYLVPFREGKGTYDPTSHGHWPKRAWMEMCVAAGVKLRPYDLRHHGLTKLAEKNPEQVVLKVAGHVSPQMLRRVYSHVRLPALRAAVNSISSMNRGRSKAGHEAESTREAAMFRTAQLAEHLGVSSEKALQLLTEYERLQAMEREAKR
jgi:integrase